MPPLSSLLCTLLLSQIGGNPSVPVTVAPPTSNPHGPAIPAATYPGTSVTNENLTHPSAGAVLNPSQPAAARAGIAQPPAVSLRPTTAQLVADALSLPPGNTIGGQPVPLVSVVATVLERQRQIEAVHAYWRLAEAIGEFHFCQERQQQIARLRAANGEATDLRTARAVATAQIREAEVQIATAQHDLAEILLLRRPPPCPCPRTGR